MDNSHYTLYIKKDCPFCVQAREEVFRQGVNHTIYPLDKNPKELQELKDFTITTQYQWFLFVKTGWKNLLVATPIF